MSWIQACPYEPPYLEPQRLLILPGGIAGDGASKCSAKGSARLCQLDASQLPALYSMSVRDYDEGFGLLIVGNAFGELVLCSITGSSLEELHDALQAINFPPHRSSDILPQVSVASTLPLSCASYLCSSSDPDSCALGAALSI